MKKTGDFLDNCGQSWISWQEIQDFGWNFFHILRKSCKILHSLPRIIAKILARNHKDPILFVTKIKMLSTGGILLDKAGVYNCNDSKYFLRWWTRDTETGYSWKPCEPCKPWFGVVLNVLLAFLSAVWNLLRPIISTNCICTYDYMSVG